jgi:hypothetical protein
MWWNGQFERWVNGEYGGINAVATDKCNDMRAVWRIVGNDPRTLQVFCVPCDSHGLQLLMQDILCKIEPVRRIRLAAEHIVASFHHAPLQYALLTRDAGSARSC